MQFGILGSLEVWSADRDAVLVGGPKPRALLVMLLLNAGRVVSVEQIIAGLYGDDPPAAAGNAVQAQVSRLRRSLGAGMVEFHGTGYRLAVVPEDVDAQRFERLAEEGRRLLAEGNHAGAAGNLREALGLWRGPALADLPHGQAQAARLEELRLAATEDLIEAELALPDRRPVAELRELVAAHPLRERLRGQLMRALHADGRQAESLAEYEEARRLLADELGADPSPELAGIHLAILRAEPPAAPARQRPAAQLTSFVGRDQELARLDQLSDHRLVTITGPGGTGKTRLAVEFAGRGSRVVCFTDLSSLDSGDQVPRAVLGALGLRESGFQSPAADPVRRLVAALAEEQLLILDNCEQVVAAVAALARTLLAECPDLAVLATSREPLGLTGETLLPLAPLDGAAAIRLFTDRATAVRPGFTVDVELVTEICTALDGLPLAIELAAARLRQFTVDEIARRLTEHGRFRLLSRGDRTAAARHQTLRAAVEWSWDLLGPDEQRLARRFAVFSGGAPLDAVEAVCGIVDVDDLLADLVDKSLVDTDGRRYRMLDTIRLFCAERLAESGEQAALRRSHAWYHLELAQRADPHLRRAEQLDWLAKLSAEHDNLMAALRWAVREDRAMALKMVAASAAYWWLSGRRTQAGEAAAELLGTVPEGLEEEYVGVVVHAVPRADAEHWAQAGHIMRTLDRALRHPFGAALWGMAAGPGSDPGALLDSDPWNVALAGLSRGLLAVLGGMPAEGERELLDAVARFRDLGERWGTAQALDFLALVAGWRGEWRRADELWTQALGLMEQLGAPEECADLLCHRAESLVRRGAHDSARIDYERAGELNAKAGRPGVPASIQLGLAEIARMRGDTRQAVHLLGEALAAAKNGDFGATSIEARAFTALGRVAEASGETDEALVHYRKALASARTSPFASDLADAVEGQAGAALLAGPGPGSDSGERAALLLGAAVALRGMVVTGDVDVAGIAARARDLVGPETFAKAYARGTSMTPAEARSAVGG